MIEKIDKIMDKKTIASEWDSIVIERDKEIKNGKDKSLINILAPSIIDRVQTITGDSTEKIAVDCGCGSGFITKAVAKYCKSTTGIDISQESIELAKKDKLDNTEYLFMDIEEYAVHNPNSSDICIANMLLSNVLDCKSICKSMFDILKKDGHLIVTLPHPCFWSEYWNYADEDWFDYTQEIVMSCDFKITNIGPLGISTHIHRPLELYINTLCDIGFRILRLNELYSKDFRGENDFNKPRFMLIECLK